MPKSRSLLTIGTDKAKFAEVHLFTCKSRRNVINKFVACMRTIMLAN